MENNKLVELQVDILDRVQHNIEAYQARGELQFPPDYSLGNALKSAWLMLQGVKTAKSAGEKPVLEACTRPSIIASLLSMAIQGLNPDKKQCYFIAYAATLTLMRSYFGAVVVAKRIDANIEDIPAEVVYEDDEFEYETIHGKKYIIKHKSSLKNIDKTKITAAYAEVIYSDGRAPIATVMTMEEIKQSWKQSQANPVAADGSIAPGTTHGKFTADMCKRTVINKACKSIINNSNDASLVARIARQNDTEMAAVEVDADIEIEANQGEPIDPPAAPEEKPAEAQATIPGV